MSLTVVADCANDSRHVCAGAIKVPHIRGVVEEVEPCSVGQGAPLVRVSWEGCCCKV